MRFRNSGQGNRPGRRGAVAPLAAVLSIFFLALLAFAIDISWIVLTESELQNATDAAALAGSNALIDDYVAYQLPGQTAAAKTAILNGALTKSRAAAKKYAAANGAGGLSTLALNDSDFEFGFVDDQGKYTA